MTSVHEARSSVGVRRIGTQSELINRLVMEEDERLRSHRALRAGAGVARARDFDDRLL